VSFFFVICCAVVVLFACLLSVFFLQRQQKKIGVRMFQFKQHKKHRALSAKRQKTFACGTHSKNKSLTGKKKCCEGPYAQ